MRVYDFIAKYLKERGINRFFGYQGGAVTPLIDAMVLSGLQYVQCYQEQASGFAADAYARLTQNCSVTVVTNGPGATNLVTAIANAHLDSVPSLFITGQVNTTDLKDKDRRQNGFQEIDTISMVRPFTKYAKQITQVSDVKYSLDKAFKEALSARKGAVVLDIPMDILMSEIDCSQIMMSQINSYPLVSEQSVDETIQLLRSSKRPLLLVGGGVRLSGAENELSKFVDKTAIPTVKTLTGLDVYTSSDIGFSGNYGVFSANMALQNADVILALGTRFAKRQVGKNISQYAPHAKIIHVDIDETELAHFSFANLSIHADIRNFLQIVNKKADFKTPEKWLLEIKQIKEKYATIYDKEEFLPVQIVKEIAKYVLSDSIITVDVGQNQMWVAQGWLLKKGQRILSSSGLGCMGYSLPAAIGSCFANPEKTVISFTGDGGLQMNLQELQSVCTHNLPIKIFVFNNHSLGMIRESQMKYHNSRFVGTENGYGVPDLKKLAFAYGINYFQWQKDIICDVLERPGPSIIEIPLPQRVSRAMTRFDFPEIYEENAYE